MYDESGGNLKSRQDEAERILEMLEDYKDQFAKHEFDFITQMEQNLVKYGEKCQVSPKQLFWLRDIKDKYAR